MGGGGEQPWGAQVGGILLGLLPSAGAPLFLLLAMRGRKEEVAPPFPFSHQGGKAGRGGAPSFPSSRACGQGKGRTSPLCAGESTSTPWVILVIYVNISFVGLIPFPSMFQISSTMEWHGLEDVEPPQSTKVKRIGSS